MEIFLSLGIFGLIWISPMVEDLAVAIIRMNMSPHVEEDLAAKEASVNMSDAAAGAPTLVDVPAHAIHNVAEITKAVTTAP
jgi:hypothetical protein